MTDVGPDLLPHPHTHQTLLIMQSEMNENLMKQD